MIVEKNVHYVARKQNGQVYGHYMSYEEAIEDSKIVPEIDRIEKRETTFTREEVWKRTPDM